MNSIKTFNGKRYLGTFHPKSCFHDDMDELNLWGKKIVRWWLSNSYVSVCWHGVSSWVSRFSNNGRRRYFSSFPSKELVRLIIKSLCFKSCLLVGSGLGKLLRKCDMFGLLFSELSKIGFALQILSIDQFSSLTKSLFMFMSLFLFVCYYQIIVRLGWLQNQLQITKLGNQAWSRQLAFALPLPALLLPTLHLPLPPRPARWIVDVFSRFLCQGRW